MTINVSEGHLPVDEGTIYWRYVAVDADEEDDRPILVFMHAGVTDQTLWDPQVKYLAERGWSCLTYDHLGYGKSFPSEEYLQSNPRRPFDMLGHVDRLRQGVLPEGAIIIPVGLSIGAGLALAYACHRQNSVAGAVVVSGGLGGFDAPNTPAEDNLFNVVNEHIANGDVQGAANLQVRIWGDGPLQEPGRMAEPLAEQMLKWNIDICARECAKTGGSALESAEPEQLTGTLLHTIEVPVAVAYGTLDETYTQLAMKHLGSNVTTATLKDFPAAHMINMELPDEFNEWLEKWLEGFLE